MVLISTTVSDFTNFCALQGDLPLVGQTAEFFTGNSEHHHDSMTRGILEWSLDQLVYHLSRGELGNTEQYLVGWIL